MNVDPIEGSSLPVLLCSTSMHEYLKEMNKRAAELRVEIDDMTEHFEVLEDLYFEV